ncbi:hypothetical protein [Hazenella coriacea]|nr:hypothetical protein [Hazenella coriacea]
MWGALGQWAGALFTAIAVSVALWQVLEMKKQAQQDKEQKAIIRFLKTDGNLEIILNNINSAPIYVSQSLIFHMCEHPFRKELYYEPMNDPQIQTDSPKLIGHGDVFKTIIPLDLFLDKVDQSRYSFFTTYFISSSGIVFRRSIYIEKRLEGTFDLYIANEQMETQNIKDMKLWYTLIRNNQGIKELSMNDPDNIVYSPPPIPDDPTNLMQESPRENSQKNS